MPTNSMALCVTTKGIVFMVEDLRHESGAPIAHFVLMDDETLDSLHNRGLDAVMKLVVRAVNLLGNEGGVAKLPIPSTLYEFLMAHAIAIPEHKDLDVETYGTTLFCF